MKTPITSTGVKQYVVPGNYTRENLNNAQTLEKINKIPTCGMFHDNEAPQLVAIDNHIEFGISYTY